LFYLIQIPLLFEEGSTLVGGGENLPPPLSPHLRQEGKSNF
jgi:hypothetical protein